MAPVDTPSANCFSCPRDFTAAQMHYAVVQVSKHRHVVVEYSGTTTMLAGNMPCFKTVSEPLRWIEAADLAHKLTNDRRQNEKTFI